MVENDIFSLLDELNEQIRQRDLVVKAFSTMDPLKSYFEGLTDEESRTLACLLHRQSVYMAQLPAVKELLGAEPADILIDVCKNYLKVKDEFHIFAAVKGDNRYFYNAGPDKLRLYEGRYSTKVGSVDEFIARGRELYDNIKKAKNCKDPDVLYMIDIPYMYVESSGNACISFDWITIQIK